MNKQELISIIRTEILLAKSSPERKGYIAGLEEAINIIKGFSDKPQKPVVPQFVAEWIEYCKNINITMKYALAIGEVFFYSYANQNDFSKLKEFLETENNQETFARAWLDGYEVEEEAKYTVKIKGNLGQYLGRYYLNNEELTPQFIRTQQNDPSYFTKAELEQTGFGWVYDCEGIEVEEVEE